MAMAREGLRLSGGGFDLSGQLVQESIKSNHQPGLQSAATRIFQILIQRFLG